MGSVFDELGKQSNQGLLVVPDDARSTAVTLIEKGKQTRWVVPAAAWSTVTSGGSFVGLSVFGLDVFAVIAAGAGATILGTAAVVRGFANRREQKIVNELYVALKQQFREVDLSFSRKWLNKMTDFILYNEEVDQIPVVDKDSSAYVLTKKEGNIFLELRYRSKSSVIKQTLKSSVASTLGFTTQRTTGQFHSTPKPVVQELPPTIMKLARKIDLTLEPVDKIRQHLDVELLHRLEHVESELLNVLRSYISLSQLQGQEAGWDETVKILAHLNNEAIKLKEVVGKQFEKDLKIQSIYLDSRDSESQENR
jgi:hypothetical protein